MIVRVCSKAAAARDVIGIQALVLLVNECYICITLWQSCSVKHNETSPGSIQPKTYTTIYTQVLIHTAE